MTPLSILYQDEWLVAIDKPSGLLVHRSEIDRHETQFAIQLLRDQIGRRVYPLHRLDKPTSGVLLFALDSDTAKTCGESWAQGVDKTYLAIVRGVPAEEGTIDKPLKEPWDRLGDRNVSKDKPEQPAVTEYRRLASCELPYAVDRYPTARYSLVRVHPQTGRRHQIRRHFKSLSHPLIGDTSYGKSVHNRFFAEQYGVQRLLLHAAEMRLPHPYSGEPLTICAPVTGEVLQLLESLDWLNSIPLEWRKF
ncbi:tRNA pseudouridine(65) synthase TruC [Hahella sp. HN01]|uniref:tRNA pseudouridine(65) synthase TruC n=1 Tax=Hahella sp. HN01 TaxID=2847262 RepID=UPI001C1F15B1|nr:tRNA pseudouridine(65) synthase TruC [Hahella sp. HN01]MBU6951904.1 tRNA pseudouridine(65) synthase TruC [Hahella sp. HN01]